MLAAMQTAASYAQPLYAILSPLLVPTILYGAYSGLNLLRAHGYQTTYAAALVRAAGAGAMAAQAKGLDPFSAAGRSVVADVGANYLETQVGTAAAGLSITLADHATKVLAQLDAVQTQAVADAHAVAANLSTAAAK